MSFAVFPISFPREIRFSITLHVVTMAIQSMKNGEKIYLGILYESVSTCMRACIAD